MAEQNAITFNGISFSSSKQLATKFNQQFNTSKLGRHTSKLGRHTSSGETRVVTRETKRKPLEMVRTFTTDMVMKAIKSCRNSKAFDHDKLSIFHLKHLGSRAIEFITTVFNLCHNLSDTGYMEVVINHPYTETGQGHLPRNFLPANLVNLPSRKSPRISVFTNNQQISHPCSRPTRFQT